MPQCNEPKRPAEVLSKCALSAEVEDKNLEDITSGTTCNELVLESSQGHVNEGVVVFKYGRLLRKALLACTSNS